MRQLVQHSSLNSRLATVWCAGYVL